MLVLSKLTNINHANGGSYDPPLFLYSALFAARGRFGGLLCTAGFGGASPHGGGLWRVSPHGFLCRRGTFGFGAGSSFRCFSHTRPAYGKNIRKNFAGYIAVFYIAEENSRSLLR